MVPPAFKRLDIAEIFNALEPSEKLYAHHISRYEVTRDFDDF